MKGVAGKALVILLLTGFFQILMATEGSWVGVRKLATLVRVANMTIQSIAEQAINSSAMDTAGNTFEAVLPLGVDSIFYTKLSKNASVSVDGTTYTHVFEQWQGSTMDTTKKSLEFYFNSITDLSTDTGIMIRIKPYFYDPVTYNETEFFVSTLYSNGSMLQQTITFSGAPFKTAPAVVAGRSVLTDGTTALGVAMFARLNSTSCNGAADYYTLVYLASKSSPYPSTAKWGISMNDMSGQNCDVTNTTNYGFFRLYEGKGTFIIDSTTDGTGYPSTTDLESLWSATLTDSQMNSTQVDALDLTFQSNSSVVP